MTISRRAMLSALAAGGAWAGLGGATGLGLAGCAGFGTKVGGTVVVVGGGYGGATAAKYIRMYSSGTTRVVLVEPNAAFVSCPVSNLVLGGMRTMADITKPYDGLVKNHGVEWVRDTVTGIDATKKTLVLKSGQSLAYQKLVLAPGIDYIWDNVEGLQAANDSGAILNAWKAGPDTVALRKQLEAMPDGGVYAIAIPEAPYRCPPGPYERASVIADYFAKSKPKAKILILDANPDLVSKGALFKKAWADLYPGIIEYRPQHRAVAVDAATRTVKFDVQDDVKADVLNVLPPMRAGALAKQAGLATVNGRWCPVDFLSFESTIARDIHVLGDSVAAAPAMPKSGHMANAHAKVAAAAIVSELAGLSIDASPIVSNTCFSYVSEHEVIHVASVHEYVAAEKTFKSVKDSGGVSAARSEIEAGSAAGWARNIWADSLM